MSLQKCSSHQTEVRIEVFGMTTNFLIFVFLCVSGVGFAVGKYFFYNIRRKEGIYIEGSFWLHDRTVGFYVGLMA